MKRPNLQVVTKALARILFDGKRATGVEFERGGVAKRPEADREVILLRRGPSAHRTSCSSRVSARPSI